MGDRSPAELLPALYRAVLDDIAELERRGERAEAAQFRIEAISAYSRSWDAKGRRRLESILRRTERAIAEAPAPVQPAPVAAHSALAPAPPAAEAAPKRRVASTV